MIRILKYYGIALVVVFLAMIMLGGGMFVIAWEVLIGWAGFIRYALPRVRIDWGTLGSTAVVLVLFSGGLHGFCRWFAEALRAQGRPGARSWRASWTAAGVGAGLPHVRRGDGRGGGGAPGDLSLPGEDV